MEVEITIPPPRSPLPVARTLLNDKFRGHDLVSWRGSFWRWQTSHWSEIEDAEVRSTVYKFTEHAVYIDDKSNPQPWSPNRYKIADVIDAMRATVHLPEKVTQPTWLSTHGAGRPEASEIVACANGLLHVPTRRLIGHDSRFFNGVAVPFDYDVNAAAPTKWLEFLKQLWPDDPAAIAALQEFIGYVISGRTDLQKILLLIGPTRAGKGVIARVTKALVGAGNAAGPTLASLGTNFGLSPLIGKPLAIISDARLGGANVHQIVERLLSISGEDMLTIDRKYREPWTGTLPSRFVVISNELPRFGDASGAIANRFIVLTLGASWLGKENPSLTRELLTELPGILSWALDGLDRLNETEIFTKVATSEEAIVALQDLASPVSAFVRERCEIGPAKEAPIGDVFDAWKTWCEVNGRDRPGTRQVFGRDLNAVVPGLKVTQPRDEDGARHRRYLGLGLAPAHNGTDRVPPRAETDEATTARNGTRPDAMCPQGNGYLAEEAHRVS